MKEERRRGPWIALLSLACLLTFPASLSIAQAQNQEPQQPAPPPTSQGPNSNAGETVLAPKKTAPQPAAPSETKKPEKINPNEIYTISTTTNLVNVDVMVTDNSGDPISGLKRGNFKLYDDGVAQTISNFGLAKAPMTIAMVIEFSNKFWGYLYLALEDAYQFVNYMQPQDWVAVIDFDMQQHILADFTHDRGEIRAALDSMRFPEFSEVNLYDSLAFTLDRMKDVQGRKAILLIATGCDTFSKLTYDDILKIVKGSNTVVYPVSIMEFLAVRYGDAIPCGPGTGGFGMSMNAPLARNALTNIAKLSGGQAFFPRFEGELPGIYQQIAGQLRTQYSLGFVPTNPTKDGKYHKLKVELVDTDGRPLKITNDKGKVVKYRIVTREGYYAPKA